MNISFNFDIATFFVILNYSWGKLMYYYKIYGLNVKSEKKIDELVESNNTLNIDVEIKVDKIPKEKLKYLKDDIWLYVSKDISVFRIDNHVTYLIEDGNKITIEEKEGSDLQLVKTFLLGTSFGLLLKQRNIIAIHGGAILINNKAVIFTGNSGVGKSTITNAFRLNNFKFLADDVSVIEINENKVIVNPAYPQQKICRDVMEKMGYNISNFELIDEGRGKYVIPAKESFTYSSKELGAICEIEVSDYDDVYMEEVLGIEKIKLIMKSIYRSEIFFNIGVEKEYLKKMVELAKSIEVYKILRPKNKFSVDDQIKLILEKFK